MDKNEIKTLTVLQHIERAYGELPDGATIHGGYVDCHGDFTYGEPVIEYMKRGKRYVKVWDSAEEEWVDTDNPEDPLPCTGDISRLPATHFENFLGPRYDNYLPLTDEQCAEWNSKYPPMPLVKQESLDLDGATPQEQ